jgi:hypothetical protein
MDPTPLQLLRRHAEKSNASLEDVFLSHCFNYARKDPCELINEDYEFFWFFLRIFNRKAKRYPNTVMFFSSDRNADFVRGTIIDSKKFSMWNSEGMDALNFNTMLMLTGNIKAIQVDKKNFIVCPAKFRVTEIYQRKIYTLEFVDAI